MNERDIFIIRTTTVEGEEISVAVEDVEQVLREVQAALEEEGIQLIGVERVSLVQGGQPVPKMPRVSLAD